MKKMCKVSKGIDFLVINVVSLLFILKYRSTYITIWGRKIIESISTNSKEKDCSETLSCHNGCFGDFCHQRTNEPARQFTCKLHGAP